MSKESFKYSEEEKKRKKLNENLEVREEEKFLAFKKGKEKIKISIETDKALLELRDLIEKGIITEKQAKKIIEKQVLSTEEINSMFEKIKQTEEIKDITKYIPQELIIRLEEYKKALTDKTTRKNVLNKCDKSLKIISKQIRGQGTTRLGFFSSFLHILDKNLILIQENTIDVKKSLIKVDKN